MKTAQKSHFGGFRVTKRLSTNSVEITQAALYSGVRKRSCTYHGKIDLIQSLRQNHRGSEKTIRMNGRLFAIFRQIGYMRNSINTRVPLDFNFQSRKGIHSDFVLAAWMGET